MYAMFSTPLTASSIGITTDFITVLASAPEYDVVIITVGGAISGYCSIGKVFRQIKPIKAMSSEIQTAITLRSTKMFPLAIVLPNYAVVIMYISSPFGNDSLAHFSAR